MLDDRKSVGRLQAAQTLPRVFLTGALAALAALVLAGGASAAGPVVNTGTPFSEEQPAVAVDSAGNALIAWANTHGTAGATDFIEYCVVPVGATVCAHSGNLMPADSASHIDGVKVLSDGGTLVILADVFGAKSREYEPEQEWQSTDGGATWLLVDGGKSVADGILNADTGPLSAVIVPGTGVLGYGWDTAGSSGPTFNAFPLASPPECSLESCPAMYAGLEPNTNPDQLGNEEGAFAAQSGALPGVLGVFETLFTAGPLGCAADFGTAYVYGSGNQSSSNNYNLSPGTANSAWKVALAQADCGMEYPAVAGGPSGFGILEDNLATGTTIYHRFDAATQRFDTVPATIVGEGELSPALSQDGSGGIYATFLGGAGGPIRLAYSPDGGSSWIANSLQPGGDAHATSSVNAAGQGWAAWTNNGSVYAQSFQAVDAKPPPTPTTLATVQTSGSTVGASITVPAGTVGEVDQATVAGANAAGATGTVSYGLYSSSTCTAASRVVSGGVEVVSGGKGAPSAAVTAALKPGRYYWQAAYSGDAANSPSVSACGSEVLTMASAAAVSGGATGTSTTVTITVTCAVTPCTVTVTITVSGASAARKKKKPKPITIAHGTFTIHKHGAQKLTLHLTRAGKRLMRKHHDRLTASLRLSLKVDGNSEVITQTIKIKPAAKKHK